MTIKQAIWSSDICSREARQLLGLLLGLSASDLFLRQDNELSEKELDAFLNAVNERKHGRPMAYIVGYETFYQRQFILNEQVLIPRPETEMLIDEAKKELPETILDVCSGSGILAITMEREIGAQALGVDISEEAIRIARENAAIHSSNAQFLVSDLFSEVKGTFDCILSNPPYIDSKALRELEVSKWEPLLALDGGVNGLEVYKRLIQQAPKYLNKDGKIILEIGYDQAEAVKELMEAYFKDIVVKKDLAGFFRMIVGTVRNND